MVLSWLLLSRSTRLRKDRYKSLPSISTPAAILPVVVAVVDDAPDLFLFGNKDCEIKFEMFRRDERPPLSAPWRSCFSNGKRALALVPIKLLLLIAITLLPPPPLVLLFVKPLTSLSSYLSIKLAWLPRHFSDGRSSCYCYARAAAIMYYYRAFIILATLYVCI